MASACSIRVRGVVQGVGFRPFVYRLARANTLNGWVLNAEEGVEIHLEGAETGLEALFATCKAQPPPAASIAEIEVEPAQLGGLARVHHPRQPAARTAHGAHFAGPAGLRRLPEGAFRSRRPALSVSLHQLHQLRSALHGRAGPALRPAEHDHEAIGCSTSYCAAEYHDPANRRFHAQPVACPACGPSYYLQPERTTLRREARPVSALPPRLLREGKILAVKGLGGYHLACDARNPAAVAALRERKYRKEKPFALMAKRSRGGAHAGRTFPGGRSAADFHCPADRAGAGDSELNLPGVAPDNHELGVMLPYTPLHHLLFAAGAPDVLVMTSANRSSEPIAYEDDDALERLSGIADSFLIGQRPIARRVDDSVARVGAFGPVVLRRARGYAPGAVATLPDRPADAGGGRRSEKHDHPGRGWPGICQPAHRRPGALPVVPRLPGDDSRSGLDVRSSMGRFAGGARLPSAICFDRSCRSIAGRARPFRAASPRPHRLGAGRARRMDEASCRRQLRRHRIRRRRHDLGRRDFRGQRQAKASSAWRICARPRSPAATPRREYPVQAAAGFLAQLDERSRFHRRAVSFPARYRNALELVRKDVRTFATTSVGTLFDTAAALLRLHPRGHFRRPGRDVAGTTGPRRRLRSLMPYPFPVRRMANSISVRCFRP